MKEKDREKEIKIVKEKETEKEKDTEKEIEIVKEKDR